MKMGLHQAALSSSVAAADQAIWYKSAAINWDLQAVATHRCTRLGLQRY